MSANTSTRSPIRAPTHIHALLDRLHGLSEAQESTFNVEFPKLVAQQREDAEAGTAALDAFVLDKFVALDRDKSQFVYQLILATGAKYVVEAGTSFGVSSIYLALAVGENSPDGKVIATEKESSKAAKAREHWKEAGELVTKHVDLREGDLLETLKTDLPEIDLLLLDIWTPLVVPTLKTIQSRLRPGALIVADNTVSSAVGYKDLFEYIGTSDGQFRQLTVPYSNGLEVIVYRPSSQ